MPKKYSTTILVSIAALFLTQVAAAENAKPSKPIKKPIVYEIEDLESDKLENFEIQRVVSTRPKIAPTPNRLSSRNR